MNEDTVLKPASDVRFRIVDGEAVVVRQKNAEVLVRAGAIKSSGQ
jgi:hypothetical protein